MRVKHLLGLSGLVVVVLLTTALAQVCDDDEDCTPPSCCTESLLCSTRDMGTVPIGEDADGSCECASSFRNEDTGMCECDDDDDCTEPFCCMANGACSTREKGSVFKGVGADDICECSSGVLELTGECGTDGSCDTDDDCSASSCCMASGQCSSRAPRSVDIGGDADDPCECFTGVLSPFNTSLGVVNKCDTCGGQICAADECCPGPGTCSILPAFSVPVGGAAIFACECQSGIIAGSLCGCARHSECGAFCCETLTSMCSLNPLKSVKGGIVVADKCECETYSVHPANNECTCNNNGDCKPRFECCRPKTHECKERYASKGGEAAEIDCECMSGKVGATGECMCTEDGHCDSNCCDVATGECKPGKVMLAGMTPATACECLSCGTHQDGTCTCTDDDHCADPKCCVIDEKICSTRDTGSVAPGDQADDKCECETGVIDEEGICQLCETDDDCEEPYCCMENGECSSRPADSVEEGGEADDKCECKSGVIDDEGKCELCETDDDCEEPYCCMENGECSSRPADSVEEGGEADDKCECKIGVIDDEGKCEMCTSDEQCGEPYCCMENGDCSTRPKKSVPQGGAADHQCECVNCLLNSDGICECVDDEECPGDEICCPEDRMCGVPGTIDPTACGDPHMTGFHGQKFDFTGEDGGWYSLVSDPLSMHLNMRVTAPIPSLPVITYITGLSLLTKDDDGVDHTIVITVKDPHSLESACPENVHPCLADGSLHVVIDGQEVLIAPGTVTFGPGVQVTAVNIPGECRSFGYETYWERKKLEYAQSGRRLLAEALSIGEWILADPTATNMVECATYVARAMSEEGAIFAHQSEHASFQIVTPTGTIRLSHGRLHQLPMRDPTDQFDLPDHLTWQMNMAIDHTNISQDAKGILGETFVPTLDDNGNIIMHGMECIRGEESDYAVAGPLGVTFAQGDHSS